MTSREESVVFDAESVAFRRESDVLRRRRVGPRGDSVAFYEKSAVFNRMRIASIKEGDVSDGKRNAS
jgi:hypothetical protein